MKTKQIHSTTTGLAVRTTLKSGGDYVPCGCAPVPGAGWYCDDGKGNTKMVWSMDELFSWMGQYCSGPFDLTVPSSQIE